MHQIRNTLSLTLGICFKETLKMLFLGEKQPECRLLDQTTAKCFEHCLHRFLQSLTIINVYTLLNGLQCSFHTCAHLIFTQMNKTAC